jgi:hypothetical protein
VRRKQLRKAKPKSSIKAKPDRSKNLERRKAATPDRKD